VSGAGPAPNPLAGRQARLVVALRAATVVAVVLAAAALVLPDRAGTAAGVGMVAVLVGVPVLRVVWLLARWVRRRDVRFAVAAAALVAVVAVGAVAGA
jgi:hypothetical protein